LKSTIFEFKFTEYGTSLFRVDHTDGWSIPYKVEAEFNNESMTTEINCEALTMDACPHTEPAIVPDERRLKKADDDETAPDGKVVESYSLYRLNDANQLYSGCASPCSLLRDSDDVSQSCCNRNLASTDACSAQPASTLMYYQAFRERCTIKSLVTDPQSVDELLLDNDSEDSRWLSWSDDSKTFEISLYEPYTNCNTDTVGMGRWDPNGLESSKDNVDSKFCYAGVTGDFLGKSCGNEFETVCRCEKCVKCNAEQLILFEPQASDKVWGSFTNDLEFAVKLERSGNYTCGSVCKLAPGDTQDFESFVTEKWTVNSDDEAQVLDGTVSYQISSEDENLTIAISNFDTERICLK